MSQRSILQQPPRRSRARRPGRFSAARVPALVVGLVMLFAGVSASADPIAHQISWGHPAPGTVDYFVILIAGSEGDVAGARQVAVGKPTGQVVGGITLFSAVVSFEDTEFLSVAAMGYNGELSAPSDWSAMPPTIPGQPRLAAGQ